MHPPRSVSSGTPSYQVGAVDIYYSVMAPAGQLLTSLRFGTYTPNGCSGNGDMPLATVHLEGSFASVTGNTQSGESAEQGERRPPKRHPSTALLMQGGG